MLNPEAKDEIICKCLQISESTIRSCIEKGNLTSIKEVTAACNAGSGCQSCHMLIRLFIDQHQGITPPSKAEPQKNEKPVAKKSAFSSLFSKVFSDK